MWKQKKREKISAVWENYKVIKAGFKPQNKIDSMMVIKDTYLDIISSNL